MSKESSQFATMARQAKKPLTIWRWCPKCCDRQDHTSVMISASWERITCDRCGRSEEYKVK